jgi:hypothetical protein
MYRRKIFIKNLSDHRKHAIPFSRQKPYWFQAISGRKFIFAISEGVATCALNSCRFLSLEQLEC